MRVDPNDIESDRIGWDPEFLAAQSCKQLVNQTQQVQGDDESWHPVLKETYFAYITSQTNVSDTDIFSKPLHSGTILTENASSLSPAKSRFTAHWLVVRNA